MSWPGAEAGMWHTPARRRPRRRRACGSRSRSGREPTRVGVRPRPRRSMTDEPLRAGRDREHARRGRLPVRPEHAVAGVPAIAAFSAVDRRASGIPRSRVSRISGLLASTAYAKTTAFVPCGTLLARRPRWRATPHWPSSFERGARRPPRPGRGRGAASPRHRRRRSEPFSGRAPRPARWARSWVPQPPWTASSGRQTPPPAGPAPSWTGMSVIYAFWGRGPHSHPSHTARHLGGPGRPMDPVGSKPATSGTCAPGRPSDGPTREAVHSASPSPVTCRSIWKRRASSPASQREARPPATGQLRGPSPQQRDTDPTAPPASPM